MFVNTVLIYLYTILFTSTYTNINWINGMVFNLGVPQFRGTFKGIFAGVVLRKSASADPDAVFKLFGSHDPWKGKNIFALEVSTRPWNSTK